MNFIEKVKVLSLRIHTRKHTAKARSEYGRIVSFREASAVGLLYEDSKTNRALVGKFSSWMHPYNKSMAMLAYREKEKHSPNSECITLDSFDVWGRLRSAHAKAFLRSGFDYLYHLDLSANVVSNYIMTFCRAKCRVGFYQAHTERFYDVMIHPQQNNGGAESDKEHALHQLLRYTTILEAKTM